MRAVIDGSAVKDERDVHKQLSEQLDFGPYYGWNRAALWDRLSTDVARPVEIVWQDADASRRTLGAETFDALVAILARAEAQDREFGWVDVLTVQMA